MQIDTVPAKMPKTKNAERAKEYGSLQDFE